MLAEVYALQTLLPKFMLLVEMFAIVGISCILIFGASDLVWWWRSSPGSSKRVIWESTKFVCWVILYAFLVYNAVQLVPIVFNF